MHSLLRRQLQHYFGGYLSIPPEWQGFIDAVDAAYRESDADRRMLERALDLSSQELLQTNSEMRAIFQAIPDMLFRLDLEGTILDCRAGTTTDWLVQPREQLGKRIQDIPLRRIGNQFREAICQVREGKSIVSIEYALTIKGRERFYEARLLPLLEDQIVVIVRDITERRLAEVELERLLIDLKHRSTQLQTAAKISQSAGTILDPGELISQAVNLILERFDFYYVGIFLLDEKGEYAVLRAGTGEAGRRMLAEGHKLAVGGESMIGWCVAHAQARIALDVGEEAIRFDNPHLPKTRSEMALPLISRNRVLGALTVQSTNEAAFSREDIIVLQAMADQLAVSIENARLFEAVQHRAEEAETLRQAGAVVAATLRQDEAIELILQQLARVVPYDSASVQLLREDCLEIVGGRGWPDLEVAIGLRFPVPGDNPNTVIVQQRAPYILGDAAATHTYFQHPPYNYIRSFLGVPLIVQDRVIGILTLDSKRPDFFTLEHARLVSAFADQVAIALENTRLFEQTRHHIEEQAAALAQLRELDRLKSEFIQNTSHELRTPLAIARGYAELLESGELGELQPEQQEPVSIIARRMRMLTKLMDDISAILDLETRGLKFEPIDLARLAYGMLAEFEIAAKNAKLTLAADIEPDLPLLPGDSTHLRRMLDNLLSNAFKFTPAGGCVTVRLYWDNKRNLVLEVIDTGTGIPIDKQDHIFERFYQVDGSTTRRYGGVGLGLALVKEVVEAHNGRITVKSQVGQGSTFIVTLPVKG